MQWVAAVGGCPLLMRGPARTAGSLAAVVSSAPSGCAAPLDSRAPPSCPTGPGDFQRCCAAGQLAWLLRALGGRRLSAATPAVLQLVLTLAEDPFPPAQATALWALQHLGAAGDATALRPHSHLLLPATQRALAGCSDAAWPAAAAAAIAVAAGLEGGNPYAQPYHDVMRGEQSRAAAGGQSPACTIQRPALPRCTCTQHLPTRPPCCHPQCC